MTTEEKCRQEQKTVSFMIALYCRKQHGGQKLCPECEMLAQYARERSDRCPFMAEKTFCSNCTVHCYKPEMWERIRKVMAFSGPKMVLYHPVMAIRHLILSRKERKNRG